MMNEEIFHQKDLIALTPYGISISPANDRPFLILKSKNNEHTLPVFLNPLEAGVTLTQSNKSIQPLTPHRFVRDLMKSLDIKIKQMVFVEISGMHQFVRLYLQGHNKQNSMRLRADEVMSLALELEVPIYATEDHIQKAKVLNAQMESFSQDFIKKAKDLRKNQLYMM